ncbi:flavin reductase family protein [Nocardiopsis sp. HNM0947]|uniref:Flavin reductase family protein n=1 Tax=Nocardiopsis coralli TaxID=2772213 RepID=A0ABR9NZV0_9ACTN|nr:flavin reductase family protein [Nocardiopsis coralli]MBE2997107.1 flavin reductase family protein [Nocardiopsis coralli]
MSVEPAATPSGTCPPGPEEYRRAIGAFASGVTVVTGADAQGPVGFACQSFASVSLEPPLVLFCVGGRSRSWPRIRGSGRFCVNVLGEDQEELCARFGSSRGLRYEGLDWTMSGWGAPALPDVLLRVHAEVEAVHGAGDHDVVIGRVLEVEPVSCGRPMVFFRGRFGVDGREGQEGREGVWPDGAGLWGWT